jgi:hypothetical protein
VTERKTPTVPDPAQIQQQIEETRAELASTIDAIADRVNPKRFAARSIESVKDKVEDLRQRGTAAPGVDGQQPLPARVAGQLREAKETRGRSVRWDRVALVAASIGVVVLFLRHRRK